MDPETPDNAPAPSGMPDPAVTNPFPEPTGPVVSGSSDSGFKKLLQSKSLIAVFAVLFAGVGGYLVFSSFADSITQTKTWQTAAQWTAGSTLDHVVAADSGVTLAVASPATTATSGATNLALKRPAVASSTESRRLPASATVDGNTGTRWGSHLNRYGNGHDPEWIYVDLGSVYSISEVKLQWETAYGKAYQVQVSNDAKNWTNVYSTTTGDGGIDDLTGLNGSGRYVRMYGTQRGTQWGYSLWEFAVYGGTKSTPATYAPAGSITLAFDADAGTTSTAAATWNSVAPQATTPAGTSVTYQYATSTDNKTWSAWNSDMTTLAHTRYLQIRANLSTTNTAVTPTLTSLQLTYTITTTPPPTTPAPTVTLTAAPSSLTSGATSTLTWSSTNATTCTASGAWSGSKATSGTAATSALSQSSTYTLSCTGAGGAASANATVTVSAPPVSGGTSGGCTSSNVVAPCVGDATTAAAGWGTPKFDDEFNGTSLNPTYWASSWFNGSSMNDVSTSASNVAVSGGNLVLTLSSSSVGALVNTNPNDAATTGFSFGYGYAEARVFFPGSGANIYNWPAWWTDGQSWPTNGEIDIAEGLGPLTSNYHSSSGANNSNAIAGTWAGAFHTYGVDREPGKNSIYWDGQLVRSYSTNDNGAPHYLIFNVGSGGSGDVTGAGSQMKVDYVRVWQK